uniref:Cyclic nucleotide-binding domain-containing protein n=1 Tax=Candidatus Kentrum eta TaxID=2126337 RepID=A0A450V6M9_9GAMM|nr:MAG: Cyclic nucleotide-binding domain-containing protein [Candidatus Kentron sp. H]VFK00475.1 MAG: Cyclic nucleotide-binding domain-containing protein [Candidatus Kentron sp. H]VFK04573.1 MAG: Cyclic nucleotide-binding domain-containing protein [Candidatus Kentron sp. H]
MAKIAPRIAIRQFTPGERIFELGDTAESIFIVVAGTVGVYRGWTGITELGRGVVFGEMDVLKAGTHSVSVVGIGDIRMLEITAKTFHRIMHDDFEVTQGVRRLLMKRKS